MNKNVILMDLTYFQNLAISKKRYVETLVINAIFRMVATNTKETYSFNKYSLEGNLMSTVRAVECEWLKDENINIDELTERLVSLWLV